MTTMVRAVFAVLLLAAVGGCGDDTETSASDSTSPDGGDAVELRSDVPEQVPAGPFTWELTVTNVSDDPVSLTFSSAQQADATLRTDDGTVVHQWSEDMFFAQQITELELGPGESETIELEDDLSGVGPGTYELTLELTADGPPEPVVTRVQVGEA